ncbi:hypothetical protein [Paraburkholderia sp. DGU8]|uniref:hypothetical protein n=1 Tax=Paraburkholderia sp. DGU8 TaxID=3161997 RepID=UPI003465AA4E
MDKNRGKRELHPARELSLQNSRMLYGNFFKSALWMTVMWFFAQLLSVSKHRTSTPCDFISSEGGGNNVETKHAKTPHPLHREEACLRRLARVRFLPGFKPGVGKGNAKR